MRSEVAGELVVSGIVNVQVQWVETVTVLHHCVKNTEPLTLLASKIGKIEICNCKVNQNPP